VNQQKLAWQSKLILLLVLPAVGADLVLQISRSTIDRAAAAGWILALSAALGLVAWKMRSATPFAALTGATLTASLMFSTATATGMAPFSPLRTGLMPIFAVLVLTSISTRLGRRRKEQLGTAERRTGRSSSQVAANLGSAVLLALPIVQIWQNDQPWLRLSGLIPSAVFIASLAALCEAAADTVSSELGQLLNSRPRMITTLRVAEPGTDGAISLGGTLAGIAASAIIALVGAVALNGDLHGDWTLFGFSFLGGIFGLLFDSLLGATFERSGWLNNDAVNFLSTCSSAAFALALLAFRSHLRLR
jgi:uncharacterized protein (TIGR00297 family)